VVNFFLSERLRNGERDIDALVEQARVKISQSGELTQSEINRHQLSVELSNLVHLFASGVVNFFL
jgi:hypothetical protein